MPTTIKELIAGVRDYLGNPSYDVLSNASILTRLYDKTDYRRAQLNLSNQNWFLTKTLIDVGVYQDDVVLSTSNWGRPLLVHTVNDADPNHTAREIPITTIQDNDLYYLGAKSVGGNILSPHIATSFNFYVDAATRQITARVTPQHQVPATYQVWFQPDKPLPPRLVDNYPLLEAFTNLAKAETALECLPNLMKEDGSNAALIAFYERRLESSKAEYVRAWDLHRNQAFLEQKGSRLGFGEDDGGAYGGWYY